MSTVLDLASLKAEVPSAVVALIQKEFGPDATLPPVSSTHDDASINFLPDLLDLAKIAASLREARDYHALVEKPLQQHLYAMHDEILQTFLADSSLLEALCLELVYQIQHHVNDAANDLLPLAETIADLVLQCVCRIRWQEYELQCLRQAEAVFSTQGALARTLSPVFTAMQRRVEKQMENTFPQDFLQTLRSPIEIQKVATRPFNPDEAFVRNLLLSRPRDTLRLKPSDIVTDICGMCSNIIEDYAKVKPRVHCVDCDNGHNSMCFPCAKLSRAVSQLVYVSKESFRIAVELDESCNDYTTKSLIAFYSNWMQNAYDVLLEDVTIHAAHHLTGVVEHCQYCLHQDCSPAHAQIATVMDKSLTNFRDRPCFGLPYTEGGANVESEEGLDPFSYPTLLNAVFSTTTNAHRRRLLTTYRQINANPLMDPSCNNSSAPLPDELPPAVCQWANQKDLLVTEAAGETTLFAMRIRQLTHLPTAHPVESWRLPSVAIQNAVAHHTGPLLSIAWITFEHVDVISRAVREEVRRLSPRIGDAVFFTLRDSALWYCVEIGIIRARRNAAGVFPLWAPADMASAMDLLFQENDKKDAKEQCSTIVGSRVRVGRLAIVDTDVAQRLLLEPSLTALPEHLIILARDTTTTTTSVIDQMKAFWSEEEFDKYFNGLHVCVTTVQDWLLKGEPLTDAHYTLVQSPASADISQDKTNLTKTTTEEEPELEEWEKAFLATKPKPVEPEDKAIAAVTVFTSGTSGGRPKGVMTNAREWELECRRQFLGVCDSSLSAYAPCWATDKHNVWRAFLAGGRVTFHRPDRSVFEAARACAVTPAMSIVPFIGAQLEPMLESVAAAEIERLTLQQTAPLSPLTIARIRTTAYATASVYLLEGLFGGRIYVMSLGGATVRPEIMSFLKRCVPCVVMENYGLTECGGVLRDNRPYPGSTIKLIDRPELGYLTTDQPYPRGEFAVKNDMIAKREEWVCDDATREVLSKRYLSDGFFLTGDIGLQRPDGTYEVIDRASAVLKLSNGKFVSPERVEQAIGDGVGDRIRTEGEQEGKEIAVLRRLTGYAVFPDTERTCLLAFASLSNPTSELNNKETMDLITMQSLLHNVFVESCLKRGIPLDEIPVATFIDIGCPWTCDNGMLTPSKKPNRKKVEEKLKQLMAGSSSHRIMPNGSHHVPAGNSVGPNVECVEDVAKRLRDVIHPSCNKDDATLTVRLGLLGCDSLLLSRVPVLISRTLSELRCGVDRTRFEPRSVRDCAELPSTLWSVPSLL